MKRNDDSFNAAPGRSVEFAQGSNGSVLATATPNELGEGGWGLSLASMGNSGLGADVWDSSDFGRSYATEGEALLARNAALRHHMRRMSRSAGE